MVQYLSTLTSLGGFVRCDRCHILSASMYRARQKNGSQVARILFLLLLTTSAWPCLKNSRNLGTILLPGPVLYLNKHTTRTQLNRVQHEHLVARLVILISGAALKLREMARGPYVVGVRVRKRRSLTVNGVDIIGLFGRRAGGGAGQPRNFQFSG